MKPWQTEGGRDYGREASDLEDDIRVQKERLRDLGSKRINSRFGKHRDVCVVLFSLESYADELYAVYDDYATAALDIWRSHAVAPSNDDTVQISEATGAMFTLIEMSIMEYRAGYEV